MGALENEVASLRQAVADNDLREALDAHFMATASQVAELRDIVARTRRPPPRSTRCARPSPATRPPPARSPQLREAVERHEAARRPRSPTLREAVARHEAAAAEVAALREAVARHEAAPPRSPRCARPSPR